MGREFCFYPQGIQQMFPDDRMLSEMGAESYAGLPLWDSSGHSIGLIAIMDSRPLSEQAQIFHLLQFMAPRAVAELERVRSERLLREREREFRTLAENMPDIVVRYDRQSRVLYINPAMMSNLAVEVLPVQGEAFTETYPGNEAGANIQRVVEQVVATGRAAEIETTAPHPGGGTRNYHVRYVAERSATGEIVGALAIGRDITERKRMEEALVSRERELRALAESSPGMMGSFYLRPDGSVCMPYVSQKIRELFGLTPQDVAADATVLMARTHPDDAKMVQDSIAESARTLTTWHVPYRILHPAKGERWMESNANPEPHPDGGVIWYGYVHDITERKQAERNLFESESRFRTLFESATDCMLILDKDGRIVDINSTGYEMLGYEEQEMLGRRIAEFDTPECAALVADRMAQIVAEGRARFEAAHVRKDGTIMPVEINTKIIYLDGEQRYFSVIRDITERKRLEQQLKLKEFALDHAQESVYLIFNNRFIYVNEEACRSLGYSCDELLDFSPLDIDADMTREDMLLVKEQTLAKGFCTFETRHRRRDGSSFPVEIHASMFEFNGQMMSMTLARDITERKQAERQLRELTALIHTVREEEKAHLAREIHDDLGGTLAALRLKISLLLEFDLSGDMKNTPLFARLESMSPILDSAVASMRRIITDLRPSILDNLGLMAALEWQACEFHKHTGIECRVACLCREDKGCTDCNPCEYTLDKTLSINLFRILQESLTNVVRHSGASRVTVEFQPCDNEVVLSISDNGRGMPEGHVIASTSYGIRGMRERVEQSGGKIEFDKPPGGGFKLMVRLQQPAMNKMS
jgi:PAS domain S-box-containing protein